MSEQGKGADEWWAAASPLERKFFRDVIRLAKDLLEGEVLKLVFNGRNFSPSLVSKRKPAIQSGRLGGRMKALEKDSDEWWSDLSAKERSFVWELSKIIKDLAAHRDEYLEIRNTGHGFRATHSLKFKRPTGGNAGAN